MKCSKVNKPKWKTSADWNPCLRLESMCIKYFNRVLCVSNVFKSSWYDVNVKNCNGLLWNCYTIHSNLCKNNIIPQKLFNFIYIKFMCIWYFGSYLFFYVYSLKMNIVCVRGCSQMTSAFFGVSDTPWCLCQLLACPLVLQIDDVIVNSPEPKWSFLETSLFP